MTSTFCLEEEIELQEEDSNDEGFDLHELNDSSTEVGHFVFTMHAVSYLLLTGHLLLDIKT